MFARSYVFLSIAMGWTGIALASAFLGAWGGGWTDGGPHYVEIGALLAWTATLCVLVSRRAVRVIARGHRHFVALGIAGGNFVYAAVVVGFWAANLAYALLQHPQPNLLAHICGEITREGPLLLVVGIVGLPPAMLLGCMHGLIARSLHRAAARHGQSPGTP